MTATSTTTFASAAAQRNSGTRFLRNRCARNGVLAAALLALTGGIPETAAAGPAHQHGTARLTVAIDARSLTIELETPLDGVLGFEHAPRTERHKTQVREMAQRLARGGSLFAPAPGAACALVRFEAHSPVLPPALLSGGDPGSGSAAVRTAPSDRSVASDRSGHAGHTHRTEHADLEARWTFACAHPAQLRQIDVRLFDAFPRLQRIDVEIAGPSTQSGARLTRAQRVVRW